MSTRTNGSSSIVVGSKRAFAVDVAPTPGDMHGSPKADQHERAPYSNMVRSFALQARLCRLCGCCFIKDFLAKPPRSPRIVWLHWYTLYAAACFAFYVWFEIDVVTRDAIELSDTHRLFTKSLLVLLHVVIIVKASGNFLTMALGCRKMLDFFTAAARFEKDMNVPSCKCCAQRHFFWYDLAGILTLAVYFVSYTVALLHQEQKVDRHGEEWTLREIVDRACSVFAAVIFFVYDSVNFIALRRTAEVLVVYVTHLKETMEDYSGDKTVPCDIEAAQKVQTIRLHLCTVQELKDSINGVLQISVVISSVGLLLVTCISLFTVITEGLQRTELWIAIGYSAFNSYEFLRLAQVSQSLSNGYQEIKNLCRRTLTIERTTAYSQQVQYLHCSINPEDISLNGSDFFKINLPLLVSMAGSIITYTVILVQTSPDLEATAGCGPDTSLTTAALSI